MSKKVSKVPDSDTSARTATTQLETDAESIAEANGTPQTSNKTGKHSSVLKEAASRPGRGTGSQAKKVAGAFNKSGASSPNQGVPRSKTKGRRGSNV